MKKIWYGIKGALLTILIAFAIVQYKCETDEIYRKSWYNHCDKRFKR